MSTNHTLCYSKRNLFVLLLVTITTATLTTRKEIENQIQSLQFQLDNMEDDNFLTTQQAIANTPLLLYADAKGNLHVDDNATATASLPTHSSPSLGEEELTEQQRKTLICIAMIVVTGIVGISIAFDKGKEFLEERVIEILKPILNTIFGELTILGFIGLIMFTVSKYGKPGLDYLACQDEDGWWGKSIKRRRSNVVCNSR